MPSCVVLHRRKGFGWQCPLAVAVVVYAREVETVVYLLCYQHGMLESTLFRNQCACTILSYLSQNIVPAPWKTPAGILVERDKNEVLRLLKLKCWTRLPHKHLFLRLTVHHDQENEHENPIFSPRNLQWLICVHLYFKSGNGMKMGRDEKAVQQNKHGRSRYFQGINIYRGIYTKMCFYRNSRHNHSWRNWYGLSPLPSLGAWRPKSFNSPFT